MSLAERLKGIERVPYEREGQGRDEHSVTPCPHGGAWWSRMVMGKMHDVGERVPALVGTNACGHCLFHVKTEWEEVQCLFLMASQKKTNRLIRETTRSSL